MIFSLASDLLCEHVTCDFSAHCEVSTGGLPRCVCKFNCDNDEDATPVCASDLQLYPSECHMNNESCHRQMELSLRPLELCEGKSIN